MKKRPLYVDTSAYLGVLLREPGWQEVQRQLNTAKYFTSSVLFLEAMRCLVRLSREGALPAATFSTLCTRLHEDHELFAVKELTTDLCLDIHFPAVALPRTLDLVHLRTARWFAEHEPALHFLTLDLPQRRAAQEMQLKVIEL